MGFDATALGMAYVLAALVRYEILDRDVVLRLLGVAVLAIAVHLVSGLAWRVYRGRVGVASIEETIFLGLAATSAGLAVFLANAVLPTPWVARSLPLTATFLGLFVMALARALWRYNTDRTFFASGDHLERALIVGAGFTGSRLALSMLSTPNAGMKPVGFLDDDPWKRQRRHYGVPVLGTLKDLADVVTESGVDVVVVAIPGASKDVVKPVLDRARELGVAVKMLPSYSESLNTRADVRDVRDVNMRDILGRAALETDIDSIAGYLTGKRVLVTGAGGSIGSELCRQIHRFGPAELIMLDRDESALHAVQLTIHGHGLLDGRDVVLNDIRDLHALEKIFQDRRPEVVFHAAALKHLPMLEQYPHEAMKTNVLGTSNVLEVAAATGVSTFVNISTDKAADPTSVLGYSKRIAERLTAAMAQRADGAFISVRFGNVLGSRGSVLHAFTSQIASGGPVTVTHPEITRYFMTVEEAVQLVVQAGALGENGEVMILDMGQPVKIDDVARQLIQISGKHIEIVYTGLREGEKLHEQLFGGAEDDERSKHPLVSHAPVSPLSPAVVRGYDLGSNDLGMLQAFEDWVSLPDPSAAHAGSRTSDN
ncbi:polysaccharide biosynthesis protein [Nocardioides sp. CF8]|uniref:polysaccharide biosynthesis protein n=1 Tax=Nocardioides sp. CF8 TaxID=110319 RepID=UPI0009FD33F7|nr:nucleoside-diphosphate sugar epimerase/dehydratase [Nocardioides sp. CF8]